VLIIIVPEIALWLPQVRYGDWRSCEQTTRVHVVQQWDIELTLV